MDNKIRIVISGYYGFNNIGDEAILYTMIEMLREKIPNISITVLSNNPELTRTIYNVNSVSRWDITGVISSLRACDLLISGGGSLLQDVTGYKTIPYYLGIVKLASFFKKKIVFYSQGIGPVNKQWNKWFIKHTAKNVSRIFVRDNKSKQVLIEMGVQANIEVSIDPVFGICLNEVVCKKIKKSINGNKTVGIYLRPWKNDPAIIRSVAKVASKLIEQGYDIYMVCMQFEQDVIIAKKVIETVNSKHIHLVNRSLSIDETLAYTACFDFIIGMRLHSLIMAFAVETPVVALSYDPKVENVMKEMQIYHHTKVEGITAKSLYEEVKWLQAHIEEEKELIHKIRMQKTKEIYTPINYIKNLLK